MDIQQHVVKVFGQKCNLQLMHFNKSDGKK